MKRIVQFLILAALTVLNTSSALQKKQEIFLQISDANGQLLRGTSTQRGYERQIIVTSFSGVTTGKAQLQFTMPSGAVSATLANMQGSKATIPSAVFTVTEPAEARLHVLSTVRLEAIRVLTVEDANGSTSITLQATRVGTTYYQYNLRTGLRTVSGKTGYDYSTGQSWNTF